MNSRHALACGHMRTYSNRLPALLLRISEDKAEKKQKKQVLHFLCLWKGHERAFRFLMLLAFLISHKHTQTLLG
jgi:hypothetical protein